MNSYSSRLILVGLTIGILAVSAVAMGRSARDLRAGRTAASTETIALLLPETEDGGPVWGAPAAAAAVLSPRQADGPGFADGYYSVALRVDAEALPEELFLCDKDGTPILPAQPDAQGDAALGPMPPGDYSLSAEGRILGRFSLLANASVAGAEGLLWTDGELLHLTDKPTGEAVLRLILPVSGYYSLYLTDPWGNRWQQDLFIPKSEYPDRADGSYLRTMTFRGLPEGLYTVVYAMDPLAQFPVTARSPAEAELTLERKRQ